MAIAREEKARETAEKKVRKEVERIAAREEVACEKAVRMVEKAAKKAQKARETEQRKTEIEKKRVKRAQAKKSNFQNTKIGEKRSIDDHEIDGSRKRARNVRSHLRNQQSTTKSTKQLNSTVIGHSNDTNNDSISITGALQLQNAKR
jgi:hypothetical protein